MAKVKRMILVHGWGARAGRLYGLEVALEKRGWDVVNLDLPGFGLPEPKRAWGLEDYARFVEGNLPKIWKEKGYVLFGHSFGGRVGVVMGAGKFMGLAGLVLCAPGGFSRENPTRLRVFALVARWGKRLMGENQTLKKVLYKLAGVSDYRRATPRMKEVMKKVLEYDLWPLLPKIKVPTLILWGSEDRAVPSERGNEVKEKIGGAKLEVNTGEGHLLPYRQPEWVAERIERWFLS